MNSVKETAKRQYTLALNNAANQVTGLKTPREGWISTMRKALGISAPELAKRLGVTKPAIYQAERKEHEGGVTLGHMKRLAEAMGGKFVYTIVPDGQIEDILRDQARTKAEAVVRRASAHMALEKQSLSPEQTRAEIERLTEQLLRERPSDFWEAS
ncbi:MAG: mobile mystery protein A [Litoreibacter sp.]|nr:mobile mystery protein A [Litoreibacter sp.]